MRARHIQILLLMLVLTALACASFGGAAQTPTPAVQLSGSALPNPGDVVARLCAVRAACLTALGDVGHGATTEHG